MLVEKYTISFTLIIILMLMDELLSTFSIENKLLL
jgi:hypothetical protein